MTSFIGVFSVILLISLLLAGLLYLLDRHLKPGESTRAPVHPSIFEFFTTLYAIFLGFALFTLWSAYLTTQRNIAKEADTLFNAYRSSLVSPDFRDFRQTIQEYVTLVIEDEWNRMAGGTITRCGKLLMTRPMICRITKSAPSPRLWLTRPGQRCPSSP